MLGITTWRYFTKYASTSKLEGYRYVIYDSDPCYMNAEKIGRAWRNDTRKSILIADVFNANGFNVDDNCPVVGWGNVIIWAGVN